MDQTQSAVFFSVTLGYVRFGVKGYQAAQRLWNIFLKYTIMQNYLKDQGLYIYFQKIYKKMFLDLFINQNVLGPTDFQTYFGVTMGYVRS